MWRSSPPRRSCVLLGLAATVLLFGMFSLGRAPSALASGVGGISILGPTSGPVDTLVTLEIR